MTTVAELLEDPQVSALALALHAPPGEPGRDVTRVHLAEDIAAIARADVGAVVILSARASAETSGYRLDVALRLAGDRGAAALVLLAPASLHVDASARATAGVGGVALLRADPDVALAALVVALDRRLNAKAAAALDRASDALARLTRLRARDASVDELLAAASACLGQPVRRRAGRAGELTTPLVVEGRAEGTLSTARPAEHADELGAQLVLATCAAAVGAELQRARLLEEAPAQRHADLLTELLAVEPRHAEQLLDRARALGVDVDGWHTALLLDPGDAFVAAPERARFDRAREAARIALEVARDAGGVWQRARSGEALLLVRVDAADPGPGVVQAVAEVAGEVVARCAEIAAPLRGGVGSPHVGPDGLRRSVAEARTALASRDAAVTAFDSLGTRRFLAEWSASPIGQEIGETLLAPLEQLGPARFDEAVLTLSAYLDHRGSLLHAAAQLHLHRNSLAYRIKRILALLEVDLDDPDQWLMLQLACRAAVLQLDRARD